jgi:hypothetical protein
MAEREDRLLLASSPDDALYPEPLSLTWRIHHWIGYMIGGVGFIIGSIAFIPALTNYTVGAWAFTIGSAGFLNADLMEWWTNNRVGCFMDGRQRRSYEVTVARYFEPNHTWRGRYQRAENGLNFFFSAIGSTLYFIGSLFFIPRINKSVLGTKVYIVGSAVIVASQSWKLYRAGLVNLRDPLDKTFQVNNWGNDWPAFGIDAFAGLGGFAYMVGSIFFLPYYDVSDEVTWIAAFWFNLGGIFFTLSGIYMFYRYFFTKNYPH